MKKIAKILSILLIIGGIGNNVKAQCCAPSPQTTYTGTEILKVDTSIVRLNISGMTCTGCEENIIQALRNKKGVLETNVDFKTGEAIVKFDKLEINEDKIAKLINDTGYKVIEEKKSYKFIDNQTIHK